MKITIDVTQEDIDRGVTVSDPRWDEGRDPISIAMKKAGMIDALTEVGTDGTWFFLWVDQPFAHELPAPAAAFLKQFESGKKVKPFSFEVTV